LNAKCLDDGEILLLIDGLLPGIRRAEVEAHLDTCADCRKVLGAVAHGRTAPVDSGLPVEGAAPTRIDEFELVRRVGRGGMGEVWLAWDTLLERDVAIKIGWGETTEEARSRFLVEARAVARLRHPNILTVHHVGELGDRPFLVTELLRGRGLDTVGRLPPAQVVAVGLDLSRALSAVHAAGVLHRDVKPANAFLCDDGTAKLLDFGLAKLSGDPEAAASEEALSVGRRPSGGPSAEDATVPVETGGATLVGTPLYMAPETWRLEAATRATDVYLFGGLLFTLLTGDAPHAGATLPALRAAVLEGRMPDLAAAAPDAPAPLVELIQRCLSLDPDERPPAEAVCQALQSLATPAEAPGGGDEDPTGNPYRGLLSFGAEHRRLFFGRDAETAAVLAELSAAPLVLVIGPSGAGKSSLVRAGVVPRVLAGALGDGEWHVATLLPGDRPVEHLARALGPFLGEAEGVVLSSLRSSPSWGAARVEERAGPRRLLLVVDQLEEAWTLAGPEARATFVEALSALARVGREVRVVATLRLDFLGRLEDLGELRALALRAPVVLGPLSSEGLRQAVEEPARLRGVAIDPPLTAALVERARGVAGMLPLLEFALGVLWEGRREGATRIDLADLSALGGLEGALAVHADGALDRLGPTRRAEARRILLSLVTLERTRARREEAELVGTSADARAALGALLEARLVVATAGDDATAYELAHEVLVSGWPALRRWLDEASAVRQGLDRLRRAVAEWERLGRAPETLWSPRQLLELDVLEGHALPGEAAGFVAESRAAIRRARWSRIGLWMAVPLSLTIAAAVVGGVSYARRRAAVAAEMATARQLDAKAEESARAVEDARRRAFAAFERDDLAPAEALWKEALALDEDTDRQRREVLAAVGKALAREPRDASARALAADVTLARLLAAERLHKKTLLGALGAELDAYDDGSRRARLHAPGHVTARTDPPGAAMVLARYREDDAGRLVETEAAPLAPDERRALEPGSYLIMAEAAGRYPTRSPFLVRRGEESTIRVVLPRAADVPEGMIYVPAGRTLYGSGDDEGTRGFFSHQPQHDVEVGAFLIARTEVENADYLAFLMAIPDADRKGRLPSGLTVLPDGRIGWKLRERVLAPGEPYCSGVEPCVDWSRLPVMGTNREDGVRYAQWLAREGRLPGARICTDREWERAARGADDRRFPAGNADPGPTDACTRGTYGGDAQRARPCAAGTHPATRSPFGVDDLTGNEWEWVAGPADVAQPAQGILRGAGWRDFGLFLAISNRGPLGIGNRSTQEGVRVCADAP
jgi:formylglycine-generating enzyme required for sulfatase activity